MNCSLSTAAYRLEARAVANAGSFFFEEPPMGFFRSRLVGQPRFVTHPISGVPAVAFITSEKDSHYQRRYTVRLWDGERFTSHGGLMSYATRHAAIRARDIISTL